MSISETREEFITRQTGKVFTFSEAIEIMKIADKFPTSNADFNWVDAKTKKPVSIGYTS